MSGLLRFSGGILLRLHPRAFRERFGEEMRVDYEEMMAGSGATLKLSADLLRSLMRQWTSMVGEWIWPGTVARPVFPTGQYAVEFQAPMTPMELLRGFGMSVLLFSAFWLTEDPAGTSRDLVKMFSAIAAPLGAGPGASAAAGRDVEIRDVTIVDVVRGQLLSHKTVLIEDGIVTAVVPAKKEKTKPDADVVDGHGKFLMPGMWDMHSHITHTDVDFPVYIANGVLGIRSMGGEQDKVFAWQKQLKERSLFGPLAFVSGPILDGPDGPVQPKSYGVRIANAQEGRAEVDTLKARGADFVKVYDGLSRESYFAIAAEGKKVGLPIAGHVPDRVTILESVQAGQRSIEHGIESRGESAAEDDLMDLRKTDDFMAEAMKTGNFTLIPEGIARHGQIWLKNFSQERADALYRTLAETRTYLCPTLVTGRWTAYGDDIASKPDARQRFIDPKTLVYWQPSMNMLTKYRTQAYIDWRKVKYAKQLEQIPRQQALGVQFLAGTDLTVPFIYPGSSVHEEVRLLASAGLTNTQALQAATTHPVEFFGLQKMMGSVEAGKRAEFVLLDGNPLADLNNLDHIHAVITHGRVLHKAELDAMTEDAAKAVKSRGQDEKGDELR